jgi:hypothetical protein
MWPQDFWSVYHERLNFLRTVNSEDIHVRATTEVRTHQVAGGILFGMDPTISKSPWPVYTQPEGVCNLCLCPCENVSSESSYQIDSLVPNYPCPKANALRDAYQSVSAWVDHLTQNADLKARLDATLGTRDLTAWASWCKCAGLLLTHSMFK